MLPSPTDIEYFLEVVLTENISRAAERLGISQPALSAALRRLETQLDSPLFTRSKQGVKLTRTGHCFTKNVQALVRSWENLRLTSQRESDEVQGEFRIGAHPSVAIFSFAPLASKLLEEFPRASFSFSHQLSRIVVEQVISFELDLAIAVNPVPHPDLVIRPLMKDKVRVWMRSANKNPDILISDPQLLQSRFILRQFEKENIHYSRQITTSNLEFARDLTAEGAGHGILPTRVALYQTLPLQIVPQTAHIFYEDHICLIVRTESLKSRGLQKLLRFFEENITAREEMIQNAEKLLQY